jgi:hypothetical protein
MTTDMTPHARHVSAHQRACAAAIEFADALERQDKPMQDIAYQDFREAYMEANEAFLDCVKTALGIAAE